MSHLLTICWILVHCFFATSGKTKEQNHLSVVANIDDDDEDTKKDTVNIHAPNEQNMMDAMNPQLIAALKEINDDPSYLKPKDGELVDLNQFQMDPDRLEEMIEIFDWIESQLPPDDPQQIQNILNDVEKYTTESDAVESVDTNYTDDTLLLQLTILPDFLYQVDNGVDFMKMSGVPILLKTYKTYAATLHQQDTNATLHHLILSHIMNVIGVATQNNPNAIQYVHQSNLVSFIINELNAMHANYKNNSTPIDGQLLNKMLFTLSSITRQSDIGLQHLQKMNGATVLYKCGKLLSKEMDKNPENHHFPRAFKKLLTMVSDIVVLNGNNIQYGRMFLNSGKWCGFMIEKGFMFHTESVLQFIDFALQRNYCAGSKMLTSLQNKLHQIVQQHGNQNGDEEEGYFDDALLTQATNMMRYIQDNFDDPKKEL